MVLIALGGAVCVSVLVEAIATARRYRSSLRMGGFLAHTLLSIVILSIGLTLLVVPQFWRWGGDRFVDAYAFVAGGGS